MSYHRARRARPLSNTPDVTARTRFFPWVPARRSRGKPTVAGVPSAVSGILPDFCWPSDCTTARRVVDMALQMIEDARTRWTASGGTDAAAYAFMNKYTDAAYALDKAYNDTVGGLFGKIVAAAMPGPACCDAKAIGAQAQSLVAKMSADLGQASPVDPDNPLVKPDDGLWSNVMTGVKIVAIGAAVIWLAPKALKALKSSPRHAEAT